MNNRIQLEEILPVKPLRKPFPVLFQIYYPKTHWYDYCFM